jgi:hypothetical protein
MGSYRDCSLGKMKDDDWTRMIETKKKIFCI